MYNLTMFLNINAEKLQNWLLNYITGTQLEP